MNFLKLNYIHYILIGTPTFRHGNGYNNFVHRGQPIGWEYGSDTKELCLGYNLFYHENSH